MTANDIAARVDALRELEHTDREAAASGAQQLRDEVLAAIADGAPDAQAHAAAAMRTIEQDIGGR